MISDRLEYSSAVNAAGFLEVDLQHKPLRVVCQGGCNAVPNFWATSAGAVAGLHGCVRKTHFQECRNDTCVCRPANLYHTPPMAMSSAPPAGLSNGTRVL